MATRLEAFLFDYLSISWGEVPPGPHTSGHVIIGTCGECKFKEGQAKYECSNEKVFEVFGRWMVPELAKDFGCIHFEKKQ